VRQLKAKSEALNTTTWWSLGAAVALAASLSHNQIFLGTLAALSIAIICVFAAPEKRGPALRIYGLLSLAVIAIRLGFRIVFNSADSSLATAVVLPQVNITILGQTTHYFGAVPQLSLIQGLTDGLRLAAIILGVAMANTVANPRKLLRSTPSALYEVATAAAVAINLAPQLLVSLQRVRKARALRGTSTSLRNLGGLLIPVLEDSIQRSLDLAASMDSRGFGRRGVMSRRTAAISRLASLLGIVGLAIAGYLLLATAVAAWITVLLLVLALGLFYTSVRLSAIHSIRTRLTIEQRGIADYLVLLASAVVVIVLAVNQIPGLGTSGWLK
jgi:energy-coupling factor transport system permease protein